MSGDGERRGGAAAANSLAPLVMGVMLHKDTMHIRRLQADDPAPARLIEQSDAYMASLYPPGSNYLESAAALRKPNVAFFGAFIGYELVACGAVKILEHDVSYGEIKRVFVVGRHRGKGLAKAIMQRLESHLTTSGITVARLETGVKQPEALGLYRRLGYVEREPFGDYPPDPLSVFMEKKLGA